ncbi:MAG: periplasmic heavy metal sensor [Candidatus Binatia bacterium]
MSKKLKVAFLVSIVLNVLLLGVLLGQLPKRFDREVSRQERMEKALEKLPEPAQSRLREKLQQMRETAEPIRDQIRQAREEAIRILSTEPFDEAAYDRQVNKINDLRVQMGKRMARSFKEVAKDSTPEERKMLAEILQRPPSPAR